jgi:hypothetical protein
MMPGMVAQAYNLSTQEAEEGGSWIQGQLWLPSETLSQGTKYK